jgi:predicted transcriptional regulator with HTH domain
MEYNFFVTLFKNKTKKRIIKKFVTYTKAKSFYTKIKNESDKVIFSKEVENGKDCKFEIGLIELSSKQLFPIYMTDEMGRNVKVKLEDDNMTLVEITPYKMEELLYDIQTEEKIDTHILIKKYIKGDGVKMISTLHNKIIIQQDEKFSMFSLKNEQESSRFIDCLTSHFFKIKRMDCIFVKDYSSAQRKYLFELLEKFGVDKKVLYRKFTTYPRSK